MDITVLTKKTIEATTTKSCTFTVMRATYATLINPCSIV